MSVWMIAYSNIKKKKGVAVSMGILILLAAAMFNVGLTLLSEINHFYDSENDRLHGAHYVVRFGGNEYRDEYLDYFRQDERVETAEVTEFVVMDMAAFPEGGAISANFINMDEEREITGFQVVQQVEVPQEEAVYVPTFFKEMGYRPGGFLTLIFNKNEYRFQIAGYTESTWFQSSVSSLVNFYMPKQAYQALYEKLGGGMMLMARMKNLSDVEAVREDFKRDTDVNIEAISLESTVMDFSVNEMRNGSTMVVTLLSAVLFLFSFLMVVVALIAMKFRISNHIETQMKSIGALQAIGYTGKQIVWSIVLEFLAVGMVGAVCGIGASYGIIRGLGGLITNSVGVAWRGGGHMLYDLADACLIVGIVLLVAWISASKAAKILPVEALRGGIKSHSFKKGYFPLDSTRGPISVLLGLKSMVFHRKSYLMVGSIFAGVTFACAVAVIVYWNMGMDNSLALKMTGYEISDILVYAAPHADYGKLSEKIAGLPGVRKVSHYEAESARVEGELLTCYVSEDYGKLEMVEAYEGTFPEYDNEIVISGTLAKEWGKQIGDTVEVETDGASAAYVICGYSQMMNNFGRQCFLSEAGFKRINPYYEKKAVMVYLDDGIGIDPFITEMEQKFSVLSPSKESDFPEKMSAEEAARKKAEEKLASLISMYGVDSAQYALMVDGEIILSGDTGNYEIDRIENNERLFVSNVDSIASSVLLMAVMILAGTLLMIILVLYMVIKSLIVQRKPEFGIYKAVGYTDRQLMESIASSFLPASAAGVAVGCVIASLTVNRLSSLLFERIGISKLELSVNPLLLMCMGLLLVAFSYGVSMVQARKLKNITVYGLLSEE